MGLTGKFSLVFNMLLGLILLIATASYSSFLYIHKAEEEIRLSNQINHLVLQIDLGQHKARQLISSFYHHHQLTSPQEANERYAKPAIEAFTHVIALSDELQQLLSQNNSPISFTDSEVNLPLYLASSKYFADTATATIELVTKREAPVSGIQAKLQTISSQIDKELQSFPALRNRYAEVVIFYKEYLLSRKQAVMESALVILSEIVATIDTSSDFSKEQKLLFSKYQTEFISFTQELLEVDHAIGNTLHEFSAQEQTTTPISQKLIAESRDKIARSTRKIQYTQRVISFFNLTTALVAIFTVLILARLMHTSVTRKVLRLEKVAEQYSQGNLEIRAPVEGDDELGRLGTRFNAMASRVNDLVVTLEKIVVKRTSDLETSEAFYRQLFDHGSNAIAIYQPVNNGKEFIIVDFNKVAEQTEKLKRDDIIGKNVKEVFPALQESGLLDVFKEVWESDEPFFHPPFYYNDGRIEGWRQNRVYKLPTGEIVSMYDDLTLQKQAEEEKQVMEQQLLQAQKMEAIGLLAGGVAHDLNNMLTSIVNYPEILLLQLPEDSPYRSPIDKIRESGLRAAAVVADLLTVARGVAKQMETVDVNTLLATFLESPEFEQIETDHPHVSYVNEPGKHLPAVSCSPVHIMQCIMNLVLNGSEAISGTGLITLHSRAETVEQALAVKYGIEPGPYVVIGVSDTGSGIPQEDLDHIFEPFYTKKVMGKKSGTGLGLSIVWNTMLDHNGKAIVHSSQRGSHFDLYFPATRQTPVAHQKKPILKELQGKGETILVVDDEPQLRIIASQIIERLGYTAIAKGSGEEALEYMENNTVDLLLLDMIMDPGLNGRETYEKILSIHPNQKALLVSGYSETVEVEKAFALGASAFLKKPYSMHELGVAFKKIFTSEDKGAVA